MTQLCVSNVIQDLFLSLYLSVSVAFYMYEVVLIKLTGHWSVSQ